MKKTSAGILMYRVIDDAMEVLLVHPGGPFWKKKDLGAWSIPKGEANEEEDLLEVAKREFKEETGVEPSGTFTYLGLEKLKSGKTIHAWAIEGNCDLGSLRSNTFSLEWPPKSGKIQTFPEVDDWRFYRIWEAREKVSAPQIPFIEGLKQFNPKAFQISTIRQQPPKEVQRDLFGGDN